MIKSYIGTISHPIFAHTDIVVHVMNYAPEMFGDETDEILPEWSRNLTYRSHGLRLSESFGPSFLPMESAVRCKWVICASKDGVFKIVQTCSLHFFDHSGSYLLAATSSDP